MYRRFKKYLIINSIVQMQYQWSDSYITNIKSYLKGFIQHYSYPYRDGTMKSSFSFAFNTMRMIRRNSQHCGNFILVLLGW